MFDRQFQLFYGYGFVVVRKIFQLPFDFHTKETISDDVEFFQTF